MRGLREKLEKLRGELGAKIEASEAASASVWKLSPRRQTPTLGEATVSGANDALHDVVKRLDELLKPADRAILTESGKLCCDCGEALDSPILAERGYSLYHKFRGIDTTSDDKVLYIEAEAGGLSDFSEHGDRLVLVCPNCFHEYALGPEMEIRWQEEE